MTFYKKFCVCALILLFEAVWAADNKDAEGTNTESAKVEKSDVRKFDRYKTITDRMPFGPEPANFNPDAPGSSGGGVVVLPVSDAGADEAMKSQEELQILSSVRVSALNVTPSGKIAVGFIDSSKQPSGTYYLKVGESRDGWTVKSADAREMKVTLQRDGVEATLGLGEGSAASKGAMSPIANRIGNQSRAGLLSNRSPLRAVHHAPMPKRVVEEAPPPDSGGSAFARLKAQRVQREAARREEAERQAAAAEQAKVEKAQAEADRAQMRETLRQIQEEQRRQRELKEQQRAEAAAAAEQQQQQQQEETDQTEVEE